MRHQMAYRKLGRTSSHRSALFRNQLAAMIEHERIITTLPKAKELRPLVEKLVTLGKRGEVHDRRNAARSVQDDSLIKKLFDVIAPRFSSREGGYTRIIKLGPRRGDAAEMAILEFVDYEGTEGAETERPQKGASRSKKASTKKQQEKPATEEGEAVAEEKPKKSAPRKKTAAKKSSSKGGARSSSKGGAKSSGSKATAKTRSSAAKPKTQRTKKGQ